MHAKVIPLCTAELEFRPSTPPHPGVGQQSRTRRAMPGMGSSGIQYSEFLLALAIGRCYSKHMAVF